MLHRDMLMRTRRKVYVIAVVTVIACFCVLPATAQQFGQRGFPAPNVPVGQIISIMPSGTPVLAGSDTSLIVSYALAVPRPLAAPFVANLQIVVDLVDSKKNLIRRSDPFPISPRPVGGIRTVRVPYSVPVDAAGQYYLRVWIQNAQGGTVAQSVPQTFAIVGGPDPAPALFVSVAHADMPGGRALPHNRLTTDGARHALRALRHRVRADPARFALIDDLRAPHAARHTAATTLLEATDGDVRLVQEVLGHADLNTLQGYTKSVYSRKQDAYRKYQDYLEEKGRGA